MSNIYKSSLSGSATAGVLTSLALKGTLPVGGLSLATIAAPISGIYANIKAGENLEKARTMYAEAEATAGKMKTAEKLCNAISKKAQMFNDLLLELDKSFSYCTALLDGVTKKKMEFSRGKVDARKLTAEEKVLLATTRALAGAVKNVIFTPILTKGGRAIPLKSTKIYNATAAQLPAFAESVDKIKNINYI